MLNYAFRTVLERRKKKRNKKKKKKKQKKNYSAMHTTRDVLKQEQKNIHTYPVVHYYTE